MIKYIFSLLFLSVLVPVNDLSAQGMISTNKDKPIAGNLNYYTYEPSSDADSLNNLFVTYVYKNSSEEEFFKIAPIENNGGEFVFSIEVPDSINVLVLKIVDENNRTIDDNNGVGFLSYLYSGATDDNEALKYLEANHLLSYFAPLMLELRRDLLDTVIVNLFEKAYYLFPEGKYQDIGIYFYYLSVLDRVHKENARTKIEEFADEMASTDTAEAPLVMAIRAYRLLGMGDKLKETEEKAIKNFTYGQVAQDHFMQEFYQKGEYSEQFVLESLHEFEKEFKDTSSRARYPFYLTLAQHFLAKGYWLKLLEYGRFLSNKLTLSQLFYYASTDLIEESKGSLDENLSFARLFAKKNLDYLEDTLSKLTSNDNDWFLRKIQNSYINNYASILYKSKQYDSAFFYQNKIIQHAPLLLPEYLENYVTYSEKVMGRTYTRELLYQKMSEGVLSFNLVQLLLSLSDEMSKPLQEKEKKRYYNLLKEKYVAQAKRLFSSGSSIDFTLSGLDDKEYTLSSYKGKVVLIDFWATWCGPCLEAFPKMQELVNKYSASSAIEFLFINTYETEEAETVMKSARHLLLKNNYDFTVLIDSDNSVARSFKVERLPTTILIDRNQKIIYIGSSINEIKFIIEEEMMGN